MFIIVSHPAHDCQTPCSNQTPDLEGFRVKKQVPIDFLTFFKSEIELLGGIFKSEVF